MNKITKKFKIAPKSDNLEEYKENINFHISTKDNQNCKGFHCSSIPRRNSLNNLLNKIQTINKSIKTKTIENCRGAQCASALRRNSTRKLQNAGITLIALIITILILLILVGVALYFTIGENGILKNAEIAGEETNKQIATEKINFKITGAQMSKYVDEQTELIQGNARTIDTSNFGIASQTFIVSSNSNKISINIKDTSGTINHHIRCCYTCYEI